MKQKKPLHHAEDFGIDVTSGDDAMFHWFLLCYLFAKPIRATTAVTTWKLLIEKKLDTPWGILSASERTLTLSLRRGGYARYEHVTARGLKMCMKQLAGDYEGSLMLMFERSENEDEFSKRLQELQGVGPKTAEIFMRETEELFARRVE